MRRVAVFTTTYDRPINEVVSYEVGSNKLK